MAKKNRKSGKNKKKGGGVRAKKRPTKSETEEAPTLVTETKTDVANATEAPPSGSASLAARADDNADSYDSVQLPPLITKYFGEVARDRDFLVISRTKSNASLNSTAERILIATSSGS